MKISGFSLIILDGLSESWQAVDASKFRISFKISFLATHLKENWGVLFAHASYGEYARVISIFYYRL